MDFADMRTYLFCGKGGNVTETPCPLPELILRLKLVLITSLGIGNNLDFEPPTSLRFMKVLTKVAQTVPQFRFNSNSKEETSSNSNSKEETSSNSNSKEETSSNSNSKEETSSNSNSKEETISNNNSKKENSSNSNISSVTLEDTNLVCSNPILGSEQSVASTGIARQVLRSDGVYVEGHIQGSEVNFTVDTGAVRTVLSVYAFNKIPHVNRPILEKSNTLACADGKPLKELGKAIFEIKLGNLCFDTEMIVANIEDEALLGLDVLMKSQWGPADIKITDGIILLGGHAVHCTQIGQTNKFIRKKNLWGSLL
ncbi:Hypothetical predicted protein [Mytilus galloprovincialis]|uniref:Peptidase A2 domain-containing protein n=1 Tax=Mytilus galloprovincialis TaxID=29158 RepID=A0A8B6CL06_MYTGA|nr:Hypothetical predicted protein [Mytilus galloprovincialis]